MGHIYFDKKWPTYYKNKIGHLLYIFLARPFFFERDLSSLFFFRKLAKNKIMRDIDLFLIILSSIYLISITIYIL
jgi:hypothetical protein